MFQRKQLSAQGLISETGDKYNFSHYWPGQALKAPGGLASQIARHSAHDGGKVISPTHRPHLPSKGNIHGNHFCCGLSRPQSHSGVPEGLSQRRIPMTSSGNRNLDLPAFKAVPQPTATPRTPFHQNK